MLEVEILKLEMRVGGVPSYGDLVGDGVRTILVTLEGAAFSVPCVKSRTCYPAFCLYGSRGLKSHDETRGRAPKECFARIRIAGWMQSAYGFSSVCRPDLLSGLFVCQGLLHHSRLRADTGAAFGLSFFGFLISFF